MIPRVKRVPMTLPRALSMCAPSAAVSQFSAKRCQGSRSLLSTCKRAPAGVCRGQRSEEHSVVALATSSTDAAPSFGTTALRFTGAAALAVAMTFAQPACAELNARGVHGCPFNELHQLSRVKSPPSNIRQLPPSALTRYTPHSQSIRADASLGIMTPATGY